MDDGRHVLGRRRVLAGLPRCGRLEPGCRHLRSINRGLRAADDTLQVLHFSPQSLLLLHQLFLRLFVRRRITPDTTTVRPSVKDSLSLLSADIPRHAI